MTIPQTTRSKAEALATAQAIIERIESNRLTQVPLLHLDELPAISGLYFATTDEGDILYIGKANDLTQRCKISQHHKLPLAIERGATVLQVARVNDGLAWAVEQNLIAELAPPLNDAVSLWWVTPVKIAKSKKYTRKRTTVTIDVEALTAFRRMAKKSNMSFPRYLESRMVELAKAEGEISKSYETLGETRGGDRTIDSEERVQ